MRTYKWHELVFAVACTLAVLFLLIHFFPQHSPQ